MVKPSSGAKMIYLARANPSVPSGRFRQRWLEHGAFCRTLPIWQHLGHYVQCARLDQPAALSLTGYDPDWDGVGLIWFRDEAARLRAENEPTMALLVEDERKTFDDVVGATAVVTAEVVAHDRGGVGVKILAFLSEGEPAPGSRRLERLERRCRSLVSGSGGEHPAELRQLVLNTTIRCGVGPFEEFDGVLELGFADLEAARREVAHGWIQALLDETGPGGRPPIVVIMDETLLYHDPLGSPDPSDEAMAWSGTW